MYVPGYTESVTKVYAYKQQFLSESYRQGTSVTLLLPQGHALANILIATMCFPLLE